MKTSPQDKKLDERLRSSALVAGGLMGSDTRSATEIIAEDAARLQKLGLNAAMLAQRMRALTDIALRQFGDWTEPEPGLRVKCDDYKGTLPCPWAHPGRYRKRVTVAEHPATGATLTWTNLNVHLIEAHGFFEGKGATFRIEPENAARILFTGSHC